MAYQAWSGGRSAIGMESFAHDQTAYDAAVAMFAETGKAAIVHSAGMGKSFIDKVGWIFLEPKHGAFDAALHGI